MCDNKSINKSNDINDLEITFANENRKIEELLESTTDSSILKKIQA